MTQASDTTKAMLERVRLSANGMLSLEVYQRLFDVAQNSKGADPLARQDEFVEGQR